MNLRCWGGRPGTVKRIGMAATCGYHDTIRTRIKRGHSERLKAEAGEMAIELAKFILSPGGNSLMELCQMAHAVIDKLEGK